ncbi:MAG: glycoside hydrolase family 97 catalytic domain-containing protein, partial [Propionibacterium sp.]|nr:glycoside hydrolase family 97 catalytic domain-containing protein [Propionibacterium sp.]
GSEPNIPSKEEALSPDFNPEHFTAVHHRYDQTMVNHYRKVLVEAAKNQINVDCHECVRSTGEARTYPNAIAREAVRGGEYDAFTTEGNSPEHTLVIPFTRMLTGPMDYTPGIMNVTWDPAGRGTRVHSTAAKQLAEAVNYFSGIQMAAETPENYSVNRGIEFYRGLPASWDETRVVAADIGEDLVTARRSGNQWWVGAMNGANPRDVRIPLSFLGEGQWVAESFSDDASTDYDTNPIPISVETYRVSASDTLTTRLGVSGGQAIRIRPATAADAGIPAYKAPSLTVTAVQAPASAQEGDLVTVVVRARNEGSTPARQEVTLSATGSEDQARTVAANAASTGSARFQVRLGSVGTVTVSAGGVSTDIEVLRTVPTPANLPITASGAGRTSLKWEPVEGATGYEVYRRTEDGRYGEAARARLPQDKVTFTDAMQSGASYRWVVRAVVDGVLSAPSNEVGGPGEVVASLEDPERDDNGPGSYVYPKNGAFVPGAFDLTKVEVLDAGVSWSFRSTIAGEVTNPFGGSAISLQHIEYYIGDGTGGATPARGGTNMDTATGWNRVVVADGRFNAAGVYDTGNTRVADVGLTAKATDHTITASVPKSALPGFDPKTSKIGVAMFSSAEGGEGINFIRPVYDWNDVGNPGWLPEWRPGGGLGHQDESKPSKDSDTRDANAFDIVVGPGQKQSEVMDWNRGTPVVLPMVGLTPRG